jgi:hypothetical protein
LCLTWGRVVRVVVVGSRGCLILRLDVLVVGRSTVTDSPTSAVVRVVTVLAASSSREASRQRVSTGFEATRAQSLREQEEQDEEDGDYAGKKHPATPAAPGAVTVVAVAAIETHVSTKVERIQKD